MAQSAPLILRLIASSVTAANRAGKIIRDIMSRGELGIVEKVIHVFLKKFQSLKCNYFKFYAKRDKHKKLYLLFVYHLKILNFC